MHIHFMGIGGCGVSGLALMAKNEGFEVSGCDLSESSYFKMVEKSGIKCFKEHSEHHLKNVDLLVYSSAISKENPEFLQAKKMNIKTMTRGEFLAKFLQDKEFIGVAGSHGKTSVTWMIFYILKFLKIDASIYSGGKSQGKTVVCKNKPWIVELDESDGSVFLTNPKTLVITNLEYEHPDFYKTEKDLFNRFSSFILSNENLKTLIAGRGYSISDSIYSLVDSISFPTEEEIKKRTKFSNVDGTEIVCEHRIWKIVGDFGEIVCGSEYNEPYFVLQNRFSAVLAVISLGYDVSKLTEIDLDFWKQMKGVDRRFSFVGKYKNIDFIDDYAHHPSEIKASYQKADLEYGFFWTVFQPHRISRFTTFYDAYKEVLSFIEPLIILPVFTAGEKIEGKTSKELFEELKKEGREVYYFETVKDAGNFLKEKIDEIRAKAIISFGAGDVNSIFKFLESK